MAKKYQKKIGAPEKPLESKRTKRLRLTICILYVITISFSALPYVQILKDDGNTGLLTLFNMMIDGFRFGSQYTGIAIISIIMLVIPVTGFLFASFDKTNIYKCLVGMLCSILGIALICFGIGSYVSLGGIFSIITYIFIMFLSVYLMLVISADKHNKIVDYNEKKPKHNFTVEK